MRTRPLVFAIIITAGLFASRAWSQETATDTSGNDTTAAADSGEPELVIQGAEPTENVATKGRSNSGADTLSVDFPDEDIRNILRNVADLFELNLVVPDTLQGRTSIKLRDVSWRQIFEVVLTPIAFTYVEDGNIIKVVSNDSLLQEPVSTEVFILNYGLASEIMPTIGSLVDPAVGGKIVVDTRSNALVITERPSKMNRIRPIIESLDKATDQVMIESKFVEVTNSDVKNIGVNWSSLNGMRFGVGGINQTWDRSRGQTSNNGTDNTSSTGSNSNNTTGSTNSSTTGSTSSTLANDLSTTASNAVNNLFELANFGGQNRLASAVFSASDFNIILSALKTTNDTKLVSNPTVVTLNNTEAIINIGKDYPIPNYTYNAQTGTYEVSGFEYKSIGIILKVTPQVNSRGFIKLTVEPEVSSSTETANFGNANIPIVTIRKTKTQVSLQDGFTMGIGGLMENTLQNVQTRVPVLGSIPLLGRLFRSDAKNDQSRNLIIFITAKTISAEGATLEEVFDSREVRKMNMLRSDLPGYRDGSDPFKSSSPVGSETRK
jgi:type IV pilus assembly protein PilQ|uniref:type II secretion system protein GspD n=1 Tax=Cephaloticoccus sp. TaxID=1985742 RepID=UPI00404ADB3A